MADITDVNRNYLELLMKNDPEYKAGLYEQTPPYWGLLGSSEWAFI